MKRLVFLLSVVSLRALAAETVVVPKGAFLLDVSYLRAQLDVRWDDHRNAVALVDPIPRYEPGGGLQGILTVRPVAVYHFIVTQLVYGIFDWLNAIVYVPLVAQTNISANFSWQPGDYQGQLGRAYSEDDFWSWAASMGQPKPPDQWTGNRWKLADMVVGLRAKAPNWQWLNTIGLQAAFTLLGALPTGTNPDPEEAVTAGTTNWDLHAYGDLEAHLGLDRPFFKDANGVARVNLGGDLFASWFRPRQLKASTGAKNPLLQTNSPYVGDTYWLDPGDWLGATISLDVSPIIGPSRASLVSGGDAQRAMGLPALLTLNVSYTYIATAPSDWKSNSPLWDYDREKLWGPGDKHAFRGMVTISLLRLGLPLQVYASYRLQDLFHGRNTRAAATFQTGIRALAKFW